MLRQSFYSFSVGAHEQLFPRVGVTYISRFAFSIIEHVQSRRETIRLQRWLACFRDEMHTVELVIRSFNISREIQIFTRNFRPYSMNKDTF